MAEQTNSTNFVCSCFFTNNIFLKKYKMHILYSDKSQFLNTYSRILRNKGCVTDKQFDQVIAEIKSEVMRRKQLGERSLLRQEDIRMRYMPLHREVYQLQEGYLDPQFLTLVTEAKREQASVESLKEKGLCALGEELYAFPVFTMDFCQLLLEELHHIEQSDCPKGRPNTMNDCGTTITGDERWVYSYIPETKQQSLQWKSSLSPRLKKVLLNEYNFNPGLLKPLRMQYLTYLTSLLFPSWGGKCLDSHKAFTVSYELGHDLDLSRHFDNAEITFNISLGYQDFSGGDLCFFGMKYDIDAVKCKMALKYSHCLGWGLLHRGQQLHEAERLISGKRCNLIIWMRSSSVRNGCCPMCGDVPSLQHVPGLDDGFRTVPGPKAQVQTVDVCQIL